MNTRVRFCFDAEGLGSTSFEILNPPVLPQEGKIIDAQWEHYIEDAEALKALEDINENGYLIANILSIKYTQDEVKMLVVLMKDNIYEDYVRPKDRIHR